MEDPTEILFWVLMLPFGLAVWSMLIYGSIGAYMEFRVWYKEKKNELRN